MSYFLHEMGYNFFSIGQLTYNEINSLVEVFNHRQDERAKALKKRGKVGPR